ncbi:PP2C family protein-serine/threonine phosphatase [Thermopolyspora sp. NPDC052614]|uniref:PP2C family protein-serine/threonine phosphatase n=1 Tax=Thermopolyspora sp. NPDC052614 TaxID=3155682 RepID=UPI00342DB0F0
MKTQRLLELLPFAVMAAVAFVDIWTGPGVGHLPLLSLGPAFASVSCTVRRTALIGLLALVLCVGLAAFNNMEWTSRNDLNILSIAGVTVASMLASAGRIRRERQLASVQLVAEAAQRVLLRPVPRRAGDLDVALSYTSAAAEARIGGDLYEVVTTPDGVRVIVGDVQGKGLEAVETAALVVGVFRQAAYDQADLQGVATRLEQVLARHLTDGERFVSAIIAEVTGDGGISFLNCGHPPPLMLYRDGTSAFAEPPEESLPLGLTDLQLEVPKPFHLPFGPGDRVLLYTDGVIEARDRRGVFYPLPERAPMLREHEPQVALDALRADLLRHVGNPLADDAAMLLLHWPDSDRHTGEHPVLGQTKSG